MSPTAFDLIHYDIWGPFNAVTHAGHKYFLTSVNDCTRFTWVYLMRQKSNVEFIIPKFFTLIETQFQKVIKSFRSDNAQELKFIDYFNKERVIHQFSCVERPVQNSVVERKRQHFINVAHALLFQSRVPIQF